MSIDAVYGHETRAQGVAQGERSAVQGLVIFLVFLLISIIPLLTHPLPPLEDYANHVSRMQVLTDAGSNANLAKYYEIDWEPLPNLMMDLVVPWIAKVVNVYLASQIFTMTIFALIMSGCFALNRVLFKRVRACLHPSGLFKSLWGEAVRHCCWLLNSLTTRTLNGKSPYKMRYSVPRDIKGLPEWGASCYVYDKGHKLAWQGEKV